MPPTPRHPDHVTTPHPATARHHPPTTAPKIQEALDARDALANALSQAGIQLPAMDIRTPWADDRKAEARYALVHLGVCSAPVALMLADVITKGIAG
ncbi:hypothetical protein ABZX90_00725 [Streptomyces sp. NPDC002935]|uniref:hypothetical protein n=1 Tax=Streptomyces sp. NPDC002935 TaxID=3154545 RepID=UPI0033A37372